MARALRSPVWPLVAVLGLLFLAYDIGAKQVAMSGGDMWLAGVPGIRVEYIPDPNDIVNLAEGTPYTVPAGKVLIITDLVTTDVETHRDGLSNPRIQSRLLVNGQRAWGGASSSTENKGGINGTYSVTSTGSANMHSSLRSGIRANAGDTVTLVTVTSPVSGFFGSPTTYASGYLAKAK